MANGSRIKHEGSKHTKDTKSNSFDPIASEVIAFGFIFESLNSQVAQ
jgi:hypothetical protein